MQSTPKYEIQFEEAYIFYYTRMKRFAQEYVVREEDAENIESLEALDSKLFAEPDIDTIIQNAIYSLPEKTMMDFAIFAFAFNVLKLHRNSERTGKSLSKSQETTLNLCFFVVFISSSIIVQKLKIRLEKTYLMLLDIKKEPSRFVARIMLQSSTR